jgi:hypothetical protein
VRNKLNFLYKLAMPPARIKSSVRLTAENFSSSRCKWYRRFSVFGARTLIKKDYRYLSWESLCALYISYTTCGQLNGQLEIQYRLPFHPSTWRSQSATRRCLYKNKIRVSGRTRCYALDVRPRLGWLVDLMKSLNTRVHIFLSKSHI